MPKLTKIISMKVALTGKQKGMPLGEERTQVAVQIDKLVQAEKVLSTFLPESEAMAAEADLLTDESDKGMAGCLATKLGQRVTEAQDHKKYSQKAIEESEALKT